MTDERALRLIAGLVRDWSVPILALGLQPERDGMGGGALAAECRASGAVGYLPRALWSVDPHALRARIGAAARVKVLRPLADAATGPAPAPTPRATTPTGAIVVGASAGGPAALRELLRALPPNLPAPVLIVQHLPPHFGAALATDLGRCIPGAVTVAAVGDTLAPGRVVLVSGRQALLIEDGRGAGRRDGGGGPRAGDRPDDGERRRRLVRHS